MLARTGGEPSLPLDDSWIYLQYARRLAEGHGLSYSGADPASTGASSWLQIARLVPGWWGGFHGASFAIWSLAMGALDLFLVVLLAAVVTGAVTNRSRVAMGLALLLLAFRGHVVWLALSGMDGILFAAALLAVAASAMKSGASPLTIVASGLLGFVRPEGIPLGGVALLVLALFERPRRWRWYAVGALLLTAPLALNWSLTGSPEWDSARVKGLWSETRPDLLAANLRELPDRWRRIALLVPLDFGNAPAASAKGIAGLILAGGGLLVGFARAIRGRAGAGGRLLAAWVPAMIVLGSLSTVWQSHYDRYQVPHAAPMTVLAILGWWSLAGRLPGRMRGIALAALGAALLLTLLPGWKWMTDLYGRNAANIHDQQVTVGRWIRDHTPDDARIAVNDAGAIAYFGERPILDLVGLTSHGWSRAHRQGTGGLYEKLESLPKGERPTILAIYPKWFPYLAGTHFAGPVLFKVDLKDNTICGDRLKEVSRIDWSVAGSGDRPKLRDELVRDFGMTLVDSVDVGDAASEAAHDWRWIGTWRDRLREFPTGSADGPVAMDGGRWLSRGESMRVRAKPGQWLIAILRTEGEVPSRLDLAVNGKPAGSLTIPRLAAAFSEPLAQIPDSLVTDSLLTVDVRWHDDPRGNGYASYHWWFVQ